MTRFAVALSFAAALLPPVSVQAAGGHFDVDDAGLTAPQHCQVEVWLARPRGSGSALHLGPACRVGPVEIGLNLDRQRAAGEVTGFAGPQVKWATTVWPSRLDAGLVWAVAFDLRRGGRAQHTVYVPATVTVSDRLAVNLNWGADRDAAGAHERRLGASAEWTVNPNVTVIAERGRGGGTWSSRLGARWVLNDAASVDLSVARVGPQAARVIVLGWNQAFPR